MKHIGNFLHLIDTDDNNLPLINQEDKITISQGYAIPIKSTNNKTTLVFTNVDDHIDGNGFATFFMIEGNGIFYENGNKTSITKGDIVLFDDRIEHGFESEHLCYAENIIFGNYIPSYDEIIAQYKTTKNKIKIK